MQEAAGLLEVFGCVAAFAAADAAAKAANVTIQSIDKNKPANADALPVPLITCLKIRGSVADVEAAMDAAAAAVSAASAEPEQTNPNTVAAATSTKKLKQWAISGFFTVFPAL